MELPDHTADLTKATELLEKVYKEMKWFKDTDTDIPQSKRKTFVHITDGVLGIVGDLSQTRFDIRDQLEEAYSKTYCKSPELGKTLFLEEYTKLHVEYDKIKNKCFDMLSKLDPKATIVDTL